jgi:hypothetical protein
MFLENSVSRKFIEGALPRTQVRKAVMILNQHAIQRLLQLLLVVIACQTM